MKISNMMLAAFVPAMMSLAPISAHAVTAPTETVFNSTALGFGGDVVLTINGVAYSAYDSGHYDNLGGISASSNYQAGFDGFNNNPASEVRNFFVFDLSNLAGAITSATLTIPSNPFGIGYDNTSGLPAIAYTNWDVSSAIDDLINGTNGLSTFADLGSGNQLGTALVGPGDLSTTVTLNATALSDIFSAEGGQFAIGGTAVATAVPEASTWAMMIAGFGLMGLAMRRRRSTALAFA